MRGRQDPRRVEEFGEINLATAGPLTVHVSDHDQWVLEEDF